MIAFAFEKATALSFAKSLAEGLPLQHEGPWSSNDMLTLAGACFFGVFSQGPTIDKIAKQLGQEAPERNPEQAGASQHEFIADIHGAIGFISELVMRVYDGDYDEDYEPTVHAIVNGAEHTVAPMKGFKDHPGGVSFKPKDG
jgi:hypothetical protein